jgi:type I restriction enzyme S subunit
MRGWEKVNIGSVCKVGDGAHASIKRVENGKRYLTSKNFTIEGLNLKTVDYISEEDFKKYFKEDSKALTKPVAEDILLSIIGSLGAAYIVKPSDEFGLSSSVSILRPNKDVIESNYLLYWLKSDFFQKSMNAIKSGAAQSFLSLDMIRSLPVFYPIQKKYQRRIASILSAYDDLIENNLKRINLLEELSQRTYEEWFVKRKIGNKLIADKDFEVMPLFQMIEEYQNGGWGKDILEGSNTIEAYVIRGTDIPKISSGDFSDIPLRFHTEKNLLPRTLEVGDISMEMSNGNMSSVGRSFFFDGSLIEIFKKPFMCASFCKMIRPKNIQYAYIIDLHLKFIHSNNNMLVYKSQGANGINNFRFEDMINDEELFVPTNEILDLFISKIGYHYKLISNLRIQVSLLKESRDILLPRLMNGTINVEDAEEELYSMAAEKEEE